MALGWARGRRLRCRDPWAGGWRSPQLSALRWPEWTPCQLAPSAPAAVAMQTSQLGLASALWAWLRWPLIQAIHAALGRLLQAASLPARSCPLSPQLLPPVSPPRPSFPTAEPPLGSSPLLWEVRKPRPHLLPTTPSRGAPGTWRWSGCRVRQCGVGPAPAPAGPPLPAELGPLQLGQPQGGRAGLSSEAGRGLGRTGCSLGPGHGQSGQGLP